MTNANTSALATSTASRPRARPTSRATIDRATAGIAPLVPRPLRWRGRFARELEAIPAARRPSALNLLHYLAMRGHDLRPLHSQLASFNYQLARKEPGGWAHNFDYVAQLLYDSIEAMGGQPAVAGLLRP